jgi:CheY-like chemotaxis protein
LILEGHVAEWILVAGNDAITVLDIEEILGASGYKVTTTMPMVLDRFRHPAHSPDLVLIDLDERNVSPAIRLVVSLRERSPIRVAVLATVLGAEIGVHADVLRPAGYLKKPFRDHDLLVLVRTVLSH